MRRATRNDHFIRPDRPLTVGTFDPQTGNLPAIEIKLLNLRLIEDIEIGAGADLHREIGDIRRYTLVVDVRDRDGKVAIGEIGVHIFKIGKAFVIGCLHDRLRVAGPDIRKQAPHPDRTILAMIRPVEIPVRFELLEERQDIIPAPAGGAAINPFIVIQRASPVRHHTVDGRSTAHHTALLIQFVRAGVWQVTGARRDRDAKLVPDKAQVVIGYTRKSVLQLFRQIIGRVISTGLNQQNAL